MKNWKAVLLLVGCLMLSGFTSNSALAQSPNASVYVVHGIPGHDVSENLDPALPVDVQVNGSICLLQGFKFGDIAGPLTIPAGNYNFTISLANTVDPCSNPALLTADGVALAEGENASVVAYLNAEGAPGVTKFDNNLSPTPAGQSRVIVQHTANAPAVDITVVRQYYYSPLKPTTIPNVSNGQQAAALLPSERTWNFPRTQVTLTPAGQTSPVIGPYFFQLEPHDVYLIYAVGSLSTGSFTLISKTVPGV
ncbi:conserved exported hypothetical protein [Acidobacteriia bacterium SbA2]|nr:conserved exported hypothetical protein [Acidobacteriia bacterium SbA2]